MAAPSVRGTHTSRGVAERTSGYGCVQGHFVCSHSFASASEIAHQAHTH